VGDHQNTLASVKAEGWFRQEADLDSFSPLCEFLADYLNPNFRFVFGTGLTIAFTEWQRAKERPN
jgi:hypothetical protein